MALAATLVPTGCAAPVDAPTGVESADHHVHIRSQAAADHQDRVEEALGQRSPTEAGSSVGITAAEAIEALDAAGIQS